MEIRQRRAASLQHGASAGGWREVDHDGQSLPWWGKPTETPAVFALERSAQELVHETCTADTRDHEDHTFCGVMFDIKCETNLPLDYLEVQSIWVRGQLGPMSVWTTPDTFEGKHEARALWTQRFGRNVPPSPDELIELKLDTPIRLQPGESLGVYVHSATPGDEGLVYDEQRSHITHETPTFKILPGLAHLSNRPFGRHGMWGRPWRQRREFVGRVGYGLRWLMWKPVVHHRFPAEFQRVVRTMMMASRRPESPLYLLQDEVVLFILNKCMWTDLGAPSLPSTAHNAMASPSHRAAAAAGRVAQSAMASIFGAGRRLRSAATGGASGADGAARSAEGDPHAELRSLLEVLRSRALHAHGPPPPGQGQGEGALADGASDEEADEGVGGEGGEEDEDEDQDADDELGAASAS